MKKKHLLLSLLLIFLNGMVIYFVIYLYNIIGAIDEFYITNTISIEDSKKNEVFICEYRPTQQEITINDTIYTFDEVWVEYKFHYYNKFHDIEKLDSNQLIIKFESEISKLNSKFKDSWAWDMKKKYKTLIYTLKSPPPTDTINIGFYSNNDTVNVIFLRTK